jgi:hypothetical protein
MSGGHEPVDYALTPLLPVPAVRSEQDGETIARFRCPRCAGVTAQLEWMDVATAKGSRSSSEPAPNLVECQCGQPHPGRPDNAPAWGCGGYWNELPADDAA